MMAEIAPNPTQIQNRKKSMIPTIPPFPSMNPLRIEKPTPMPCDEDWKENQPDAQHDDKLRASLDGLPVSEALGVSRLQRANSGNKSKWAATSSAERHARHIECVARRANHAFSRNGQFWN
jgi:hypothetical protein